MSGELSATGVIMRTTAPREKCAHPAGRPRHVPLETECGGNCWIGDDAVIYNIDEITIGDDAVVSQHAYLCAGTHDARDIS
jgi:acetyltransferase-like isoleucine patch superfamily enzyme